MICSKCKQNKSVSSFYKRSDRNWSHSYCKDCFNQYCSDRWIRKKEDAVKYKGGKCEDCKGVFPYYIYDFHHLDPSKKEYTFSKIKGRSWKTITKELDKCVLLCCMCHRHRHQKMVGQAGIEPT
jgi:hypothetical protein